MAGRGWPGGVQQSPHIIPFFNILIPHPPPVTSKRLAECEPPVFQPARLHWSFLLPELPALSGLQPKAKLAVYWYNKHSNNNLLSCPCESLISGIGMTTSRAVQLCIMTYGAFRNLMGLVAGYFNARFQPGGHTAGVHVGEFLSFLNCGSPWRRRVLN